jgi:methyltransferase (TIGR00027 family)
MITSKMSQSAINAAFARAAHLFFDTEPKVLRDEYAWSFSGMKDESAFIKQYKENYANLERISKENARAFSQSYRALAVIRHRYTEDELTKALERGVSQYVILGAGLDSFAYRRHDLQNRLRVFEVDRPEAQEWKKAQLHELGISLPQNLTFVPVDFEKQILTEELYKHGMNKIMPVFFSWLGVSQYLTEPAVFQTLRQIAAAPSGTEIVFEYVLTDSLLSGFEKIIVAGSRAMPDEPWKSQFDTIVLMKQLKEMGFSEVTDFGPNEANALYLASRADEISQSALEKLSWNMLRIAHLMKAIVGTRSGI